MTKTTQDCVGILLTGCNPSDDAWDCLMPDAEGSPVDRDHAATVTADGLRSIEAAVAQMTANPNWQCVVLASPIACVSLDEALEHAQGWRTSSETLHVFRDGDVYLHLSQRNSREAEIEFEVRAADGGPLLKPAQPQ